jgi:hypothetical protein
MGKKFCNDKECLVQNFEHYHLDEYTITFRKPEKAAENNYIKEGRENEMD